MQNVTALLLAAGFGTRLGELTKKTPKPLVAVGSHKLIDFSLWQIQKAGFSEVVINLHHLSDQIVDYLGSGDRFGIKIKYSKEESILDTGGAIKKVMVDNPRTDILVYNTDAVFGVDLDLAGFIKRSLDHESKPIASMMLYPPPTPNPFGVIQAISEKQGYRVVKILDSPLKDYKATSVENLIFPGIHLLNERSLNYMQSLGEIFCSIKSLYPLFLENKEFISAEIYSGYWNDTGTPERLSEVNKACAKGKIKAK